MDRFILPKTLADADNDTKIQVEKSADEDVIHFDLGEWESKYDIEKRQFTGFIAQEVEQAAQSSVGYDFSGMEKAADEVGMYSVLYSDFVMPLVKAVQEQQMEIEKLEIRSLQIEKISAGVSALKIENAALKAELHASKSQLDKITAALAGAGIAVEK